MPHPFHSYIVRWVGIERICAHAYHRVRFAQQALKARLSLRVISNECQADVRLDHIYYPVRLKNDVAILADRTPDLVDRHIRPGSCHKQSPPRSGSEISCRICLLTRRKLFVNDRLKVRRRNRASAGRFVIVPSQFHRCPRKFRQRGDHRAHQRSLSHIFSIRTNNHSRQAGFPVP